MQTECKSQQLSFERFGRREVTGRFDGGWMTSDGGRCCFGKRIGGSMSAVVWRGVLLTCDPGRTEHDLAVLLAQWVMGLALGYEDLNDHDRVRTDAAPALASGYADVVGAVVSASATRGARWRGRARATVWSWVARGGGARIEVHISGVPLAKIG